MVRVIMALVLAVGLASLAGAQTPLRVKSLQVDSDTNGTAWILTETGGSSLVSGPSSATNGRFALFDGTTGKLLKQGSYGEADMVRGVASSTDRAIATWDGTTGDGLRENASFKIDAAGRMLFGAGLALGGKAAIDSVTGDVYGRAMTIIDNSSGNEHSAELSLFGESGSEFTEFATSAPLGLHVASDVKVFGNTILGSDSGSSVAINSGAPTVPNITTGTDTHFLTIDSGNVVRKEAVGANSGSLSGITEVTVVNGLITSISGAECPYVYLSIDNKDVAVGEIIRNMAGRDSEGTDVLPLPVLTNKITIRELKDEVSHINSLSLVVSTLGGGRKILRAKEEELRANDDRFHVMRKGESLEVTFPSLPRNAVSAAVLATGYYERTKATE